MFFRDLKNLMLFRRTEDVSSKILAVLCWIFAAGMVTIIVWVLSHAFKQ